jgi:hypothetical protein
LEAKIATARQKQAEATALHAKLPKSQKQKTVAKNGGAHISGYDTDGKKTPNGFSSEGRNPEKGVELDNGLKKTDGTDYQSPANSSVDPKKTKDGKIVGSQKDGETIEGGAAATHAERQSLTAQNKQNTNDPIGVSKEQCGDCREQHQAYAQSTDRPGYPEPIVVADPEHTRVYNSDGTVDVFDKNNQHVTTAAGNQPPSASRNNYEGVPW